MEAPAHFYNDFNHSIYYQVVNLKKNLESRQKLEPSLRLLCRMQIDIIILETTLIDETLVRSLKVLNRKLHPIGLWLLRRFEEVRMSHQVGRQERIKKYLVPSRPERRIMTNSNKNLSRTVRFVDKRTYLNKKEVDKSSLFGICMAQIEERLKKTLKDKNNDHILPLVSKISAEQLSKCEEQVPCVKEFSSLLWPLMTRRDFPSCQNPPNIHCPKDIYIYHLHKRMLLQPIIQSMKDTVARRELSIPPTIPEEEQKEALKACWREVLFKLLTGLTQFS